MAKLKLNEITLSKPQLNQKNCGKVEIKSNDSWQNSISSKKTMTNFKLNQMNHEKVQLNKKDHGKPQSKSNDPWQNSISSKTLRQA